MNKHFNKTFFPKVQEKKWVKKLLNSKTFKAKKKDTKDGESPMIKNMIKNWFKEYNPSVTLWILIFLIIAALTTCSECEFKYKYKNSLVDKYFSSNKK